MIPQYIKKIARKFGINRNLLDIPYYYLPYLMGKGKALFPKQLTVELTYLCNLNCEMCPLSIDSQKDNKNSTRENRIEIEEWKNVIKNFQKAGGKRLKITGGEPLLVRGFDAIIRSAETSGLECTVLSNAVLIDKENADKIVSSNLTHLIISLDGPPRIHDKIRGTGMYEKAIQGIKNLSAAKKEKQSGTPRIHAALTLTTSNQEYLCEFVETLPTDLFETVSVNRIFYTTEKRYKATCNTAQGEFIKKEDWLLPRKLCEYNATKVKEQITEAKKAAEAKGMAFLISPVFHEKYFDEQIKYDPPPFARQCYHPWLATRIDPEGNVYPCSISLKMGNIKDKSLVEIWNDKPYTGFRKLIKEKHLLPMCSTCCILTRPEWNLLPTAKVKFKK